MFWKGVYPHEYMKKGVYPYAYMNDWKKLNATSLLEKEGFYNHLNMEDFTEADYTYVERVRFWNKKN